MFLPGESQRRGSLVGCRLWGRTESDTTEATWWQQQHSIITQREICHCFHPQLHSYKDFSEGKADHKTDSSAGLHKRADFLQKSMEKFKLNVCSQDSGATSLSLFTFTHWRRKWQPTPVFLPGESQGPGSLVGCRLWDRTESDTTEAT